MFRFFASGLSEERHAPFAPFYLCQLAERLGAQTYDAAQRRLALPKAPVASRYEIEFMKKHNSKPSRFRLALVDAMEGRIADETAFNAAQIICWQSEGRAEVAVDGFWLCPKCQESVGSYSNMYPNCYTRMLDRQGRGERACAPMTTNAAPGKLLLQLSRRCFCFFPESDGVKATRNKSWQAACAGSRDDP